MPGMIGSCTRKAGHAQQAVIDAASGTARHLITFSDQLSMQDKVHSSSPRGCLPLAKLFCSLSQVCAFCFWHASDICQKELSKQPCQATPL